MNDLALEAELLKLDFQNMLVKWGSNSPTRRGMHASAVLVADSEWCTREQVLLNLFPEQAEKPPLQPWDWRLSAIFENGWDLHRRWQRLFLGHGNVVWSPVSAEQASDIPHGHRMMVDGQWRAAELDLTHFDETRNVYFSPDAILRFGGTSYVTEIKGIKDQAYQELTDDLEQACAACETVYKAREQANLYMHLLGLDRAILLIENKSSQDFRVWVIEYDQERAWKYTARMSEVKGRTVLSRKSLEHLPARRCQAIDDPRARRCPLKQVCFIER